MRYLLFFAFVIFAFSCSVNMNIGNTTTELIKGEGAIVSRDIPIDMFRFLEVDVNANIELVQSDSLNAHIEGPQNIVDLLKVSVSNSHMVIKMKKSNCHINLLKITLFVPSIHKITLNGGGNLYLLSWKNEEKINFINNGSANFYIGKLEQVKNISIMINGSGSYFSNEDSEKLNHLHCLLNGSGDINIEKIPSIHATAEVNGSGNIEIGETEHLNVSLVGSGNITYLGNPKLHQSILGSGSIHQK
jgi:hypothetical protein